MRKTVLYALTILVLFVIMVISLFVGAANLSIVQVLRALLTPESSSVSSLIVLQIRLPRILMAGIVGASLAVSGVVMQALFKNPLSDPYVTGIASGSAIGAAIAILFGVVAIGFYFLPVLSFIGAILTIFFVYYLSKMLGGRIEVMLLIGMGMAMFLAAILALLMYISSQTLVVLIFWLMGSFSGITWTEVFIAFTIIAPSVFILFLFGHYLNALMLGEEHAQYLGVNLKKARWIFLTFSSLIIGTAVSFAGIIGFVGLIVPHALRIMFGTENKNLIILSAFCGAAFMILTDTLSRILISPSELPVGIVTSLIGVPVFIYLLKRRTEYWRG